MPEDKLPVPKKERDALTPDPQAMSKGFAQAFRLVDDVVLKNYITALPQLEVVPLDKAALGNNLGKIRLFRISEMVYERDESATYKFASVFNAVAATDSAIVTVIDSDGVKTDFYLGIRSLSEQNSTQTSYATLTNAMKGQFPGMRMENLKEPQIKTLLESIDSGALTSVSCVANNKNKDFVGNEAYIQGLEKLALAMQGSRYTAVIIANSTSQDQLNQVRKGYETIYTHLSPYANSVVNYGTNSASSINRTETQGEQSSNAHTENQSNTETKTETKNVGESVTKSGKIFGSKVGSTIGATLSVAGAVVGSVIPGIGTAIGAGVGGAIGGLVGAAISTATDKTVSRTSGGGSESLSSAVTSGTSDTVTEGTSHSLATSLGLTSGQSENLQLTVQNKPIMDMLDRIDRQIKRLDEFESVGMWECAAYFMSNDSSVSKAAAATYKALMSGENTGLEVSALNTWRKSRNLFPEETVQNERISEYVLNFIHPVFTYQISGRDIPVMPTNLVSGNELAIHMGLPRNSVCGFPVIEHADFGKEVVRYGQDKDEPAIKLGKIFNMGRPVENSKVLLDVESLAMHTFVAGATGSGKTNTVCQLIDKLVSTRRDRISFMVIEPAKGEYKRIFGHRKSVRVLGTNPAYTELLKINPFRFPDGIHVLEHIDRFVEICNVCWPMYAAMPAVLKEAVLKSYENCGWDLTTSENMISDRLYPSFRDLLEQLESVIDNSGYSQEVKSNYKGALLTRVKSLTNGLNGMLFSANEVDNSVLFDSNVVVDLSRVGAQETKALLMGILVMRLSEHRMAFSEESNAKLRHITVLEEAHNLLRANAAVSAEEGGSVAGKSVEMISNAIAEMRTYGEGFVIADQSPNAVDISAIRNTNTKIIMRLPEETDRRMVGKAAACRENQIDEIAKLPKGVAVIYQNDWVEPVLCQVDRFDGVEREYERKDTSNYSADSRKAKAILINWIAKNRLDRPDGIDIRSLDWAIENAECGVGTKMELYALKNEQKRNGRIRLWNEKEFLRQSNLIKNILNADDMVEKARSVSPDMISFNCCLNTMIARQLDSPSDDEILCISHCLLKVYGELKDGGMEYYRSWYEEVTEGRRLM